MYRNKDVIAADNFSFSYYDRTILKNVNFRIKKNEFVLIKGDNGSGKSTLLKCLNGLIPHYINGKIEGSILLDGVNISLIPIWEIAKKVGSVLQNFQAQLFTNIVEDELNLMSENFAIPAFIARDRITEVVNLLELGKLLNSKISQLSYGQMQKVVIGSVLTLSPDVLLFDEPTSNIDNNSVLNLVKILSNLKDKGKTIILSENNCKPFLSLADKVFLLKKGAIEYILPAYTGNIDAYNSEVQINNNHKNLCNAQNIFECTFTSFAYNDNTVLKNVSFALKQSECIGIIGDNGSGKTTLAKIFAGLLPAKNKIVHLKRKKIGLVLQNLTTQLFFDSVFKEIDFCSISKEYSIKILKLLDLYDFKDYHPYTLSQGQKQMLIIGSVLAKKPDILIADEPSSNLDAYHKNKLAEFLLSIQDEGLSPIILSHDIAFLKTICNKLMQLKGGYLYEI